MRIACEACRVRRIYCADPLILAYVFTGRCRAWRQSQTLCSYPARSWRHYPVFVSKYIDILHCTRNQKNYNTTIAMQYILLSKNEQEITGGWCSYLPISFSIYAYRGVMEKYYAGQRQRLITSRQLTAGLNFDIMSTFSRNLIQNTRKYNTNSMPSYTATMPADGSSCILIYNSITQLLYKAASAYIHIYIYIYIYIYMCVCVCVCVCAFSAKLLWCVYRYNLSTMIALCRRDIIRVYIIVSIPISRSSAPCTALRRTAI